MWFSGVAEEENPGLEELQGFVRATMTFLNFVLKTPEFGFLWENDRDLFGLAFETFNTDVLHSAANLIEVVPFIPQAALNVHGLVGRPMRFELSVVDSIGNQWDRVRKQFSVREWFKKILDAIDAILDSLIAAAGGVGGLIKEFKDALSSLA